MTTEQLAIVLIHWKIKKGLEEEFEQKWKTEFIVKDRKFLVGEFLSKVEERSAAYQYITWPIMCDNPAHEEQCSHYINVGIWNSHSQFFHEVGQYMKDDKQITEFEIERRRRIAITPAEWRRGPVSLPDIDSPGTK